MFKYVCCTGASILFFFSISLSQNSPQGDPAEIKSVIINSNNITTILYNYGSVTRPNIGGNIYDFVWRGLGYGYEFAPLLAAEVVNALGETLRIVDDGLWLANQGDYSPGGLKWGWLPRAGYARNGQPNLATNNNPASWPTSWTQWPGEQGNGVVIGLNEAFYKMDDFTNAEFPYYPFPNDSTKRGLGVSVEGRVYQFGGGLRDALIIKYKLKNESPKPLNKCYFGFYGDPHVGGPGSFNDDLTNLVPSSGPAGEPLLYQARNTMYVWDVDGIGDGGKRPGFVSFKFLQTPQNRDVNSCWALPFGGLNFPSNDPLFYQLLSANSIDTNQVLFHTPGDNIVVSGSGPFSLLPGESTFVALGVFLSENYQDMLNDANYIHFAWHWPNIGGSLGEQGGDQAYRINLVSPGSGVVSGSVPITWQYLGTDPNAKVLVECSFDRGTAWKAIAWNHPVGQPLTWNTNDVRDGVNYSLRIVAHNEALTRYFYDVSDQRFTVNNPPNAQPELRLDLGFEGTTVNNPPLTISWVSEDADNPNLNVAIAYAFSVNGPFTEIHSANHPNGTNIFAWDFTNLPNASTYFLRVTASDGVRDTTLTSRSFSINQERGLYQQSSFNHVTGNSTSELRLQVVNPAQLTRHTYELTFNVTHPDSAKFLNIRDVTTSVTLLSNYRISQTISTPLFDGLKLTVLDKPSDINTTKSRFNRSALDSTVNFNWTAFPNNPRAKVPLDWYMAFNSLETQPNGRYVYPGDTVHNQSLRRVVVCPFYIRNIDSMQPGYAVVANALADSLWKPGRPFVLRPQPPVGNQVSYQINMNFTETIRPTFGDTLWIITDKAITAQDVFRFVADSNYITAVTPNETIADYHLFTNYPNPFNPTTTIRYDIPRAGMVNLKVFDILGREVAGLVQEFQPAGSYSVQMNASNLASGVYFYRLQVVSADRQAGSFISARKMIVLK